MGKTTFDKKKERERRVKKELLAKRTILRAKAKKQREEDKQNRDIQRQTNKIDGKTIRTRTNKEAVNQLHHNLEILKALEEEHRLNTEAQQNAPMLNNTDLSVMPPKEESKGIGASADVAFIPNPASNEDVNKEKDE
jgi:hypothetical protein